MAHAGSLGGTGTVGPISAVGGTITPGASPGILTGRLINANSAVSFLMEINGPGAGSGYDRLQLNEFANLDHPTLNLSLGYVPVPGDTFAIVQSTGSFGGLFNGLSNNTVLNVGGQLFRINYTSNAAILTALGVAGMNFYTIVPCRAVDTREPDGPLGGPALVAGTDRDFPITASTCGIPSTAKALALNVTAIQPTAGPGFLTLYPAGTPLPPVSTLNYSAGQTRSNNSIVSLGDQGNITVRCTQSAGTAHMVIDVNGYFQ